MTSMFQYLTARGLSEQEIAHLLESMAYVHPYFQHLAQCQQADTEHQVSDAETEGYDECGGTDEEWEHTDTDIYT